MTICPIVSRKTVSFSHSKLYIIIIIIMSFTAKIDSEKLNDDEIDDRMLADRLLLVVQQ